ncbi:beta-ketoacyl-[acyl-carrier-protein] synthase family protein [Novosphingobium sp.]|uniref:beta-ketoacyl-[acyl-carrier-protein] synthase family protein n=1 Tax=Novosphingobium sp. TaxID=1874826 RepID=UPI002B45FD8A|nr:beta-ketoacyl-[acyl-carrier-protein] synthase family protein [Novosphingobium sp.]HKR90858.1 beta-ketoacyl-[acyl-carrier-protein] synthase family protein [Novosphingobium sp.]
MKRKVVITGMGCISGLGSGVNVTWKRALNGDGAIRSFIRESITGVASWIDDGETPSRLSSHDLRRMSKLDRLSLRALEAACEAVEQAGLAGHPVFNSRAAIIVGCGSGGNATIDAAYERLFSKGHAKVHPQTIPASMISAPAAHIAMLLGAHGPTFTLSSACASSGHALGEAMHMIRAGRIDAAIAGGTEACLSLGSWTAWQSLGVLASDTCRPFSQDRQGMVLGEGAAMFVLEGEDHARARNAKVIAELAGYGASTDAAHMTAPDIDGIAAAIESAYADAGVPPGQPALISSHGTGTALNDPAEAAALQRVYGSALHRHTVIATKSAHGHMIGAAGAIEFLLGVKALVEGIAPPILNHIGPDPACDLPLALSSRAIDTPILASNSFAFGGLNAVLIGRRA